VQPAHLAGPADELVCSAGHRGDDDRDLVPRIRLPLYAERGIADPFEVGNRGPAEFLDNARHSSLVMPQALDRNARIARQDRARRHGRRTFRAK